jgi:hypothetical protein
MRGIREILFFVSCLDPFHLQPMRRGATMGGNQTNQTGREPLEQVGEALGGVFGGGENQSLYLESSSALLFQYTVKSTRPYCLQYQNYKKEIIIANFSL